MRSNREASAWAVHGDGAVLAGEIDLKMHPARNERGYAGAVGSVLKGHNPEFRKAL